MAIQPPPVPPEPRKTPPVPQPQPRQVDAPAMPAGAAALPAELANEFVEPQSIWQHPFVQDVLPFLTSLSLHVGLILIGWLAFHVVQVINAPHVEQIIIPEAEMANGGPEGGIPHPGLGGDPTRDAAQDKFPDVPKDSKGIADKKGPELLASLQGAGSGDSDASSALIADGATGRGKGAGVGFGVGSGFGSGTGDGTGQLAPFGVPGGGGGVGPKSNFIGLGGNARRIAYVCDASGSMLNMFDSLRIELRHSIDKLVPVQSFNVLFFQEKGFKAAEANSLMMANPENKRKTYDFLEKTFVSGGTDPIPALEAAFKQNPELIYLLTDGDFSGVGNQAVIDFCKRRTADGKVKINTIAFISKDTKDNPQDLEFVKALQEIAKSSGGRFKHVSDDDLAQN